MRENYSDGAASSGGVSARELIGQLLPAADPDLLIAALLAERASGASLHASPDDDNEEDNAARELRRVRTLLALGDSARMAQHALNNPLTALMAEAQLLELEPLAPEHRQVVSRLVELARRIAAAVRRLDIASADGPRRE